MPKYQTEYDRIRPKTEAGDELLPVYQERTDQKGKTYLKKIGDTNVYEKIQASLEETQTYNIIERYKQTGDITLLNQRKTIYGDFTDIPNSPADLQNTLVKAQQAFDSLDRKVREAFENDAGMFTQAILNGTFKDKMQKFVNKKPQQQQTKTEQKPQQQTQGVNSNE